jgi:REP element-mobilizing transposase RayT
MINEYVEQELYAIITTIASKLGSYVYKIGGEADHIHILLTLPRTMSVAELIEQIKKQSSKWIKTKNKSFLDFSWQKGYGIFSVSESQRFSVENYIENQKQHHMYITYQDEFKNFLNAYKVPYNEVYLWE